MQTIHSNIHINSLKYLKISDPNPSIYGSSPNMSYGYYGRQIWAAVRKDRRFILFIVATAREIQDGRDQETFANSAWILKLRRETWHFSDLWGEGSLVFHNSVVNYNIVSDQFLNFNFLTVRYRFPVLDFDFKVHLSRSRNKPKFLPN